MMFPIWKCGRTEFNGNFCGRVKPSNKERTYRRKDKKPIKIQSFKKFL
jgi:hypothetical protein